MIRLTAKAALTNFNGPYVVMSLVGLVVLFKLFASDSALHNLLMSFGLVVAAQFGLVAGTTLTEIKVKPLSYVLPGQERSMAPAMLLIGVLVCAASTVLISIRPVTAAEIPVAQQLLSAFGFGLGIFALAVASCVVTHDTLYTSLIVTVPLVLLLEAIWHESFLSAWIAVNVALAEHPVLGAAMTISTREARANTPKRTGAKLTVHWISE